MHTRQELWNNILIPPTPNTHTHTCMHCLLFVKLHFERVSHLISQAGPEHVIFLSQPSNQMVFQLCLTLSGCGLLCGRDGISCLVVKKCSRKQKQMLMIKSNFLHSFRNVCCTLTMSRYHSRCWRWLEKMTEFVPSLLSANHRKKNVTTNTHTSRVQMSKSGELMNLKCDHPTVIKC